MMPELKSKSAWVTHTQLSKTRPRHTGLKPKRRLRQTQRQRSQPTPLELVGRGGGVSKGEGGGQVTAHTG